MDQLRILAIAGSLRRESYNRFLLQSARELAPRNLHIEIYDRLHEIPPFNEDVEKNGDPDPVRSLKARIRVADAILIATPEYNYSIPGVLKNAIDWASRPPYQSVLNRKLCGMIGASMGWGGTVRAQLALRQSLLFTDTQIMLQPELMISAAHEKFRPDGRLIDEMSRKHLEKYLAAFESWVRSNIRNRDRPAETQVMGSA